MVPKKRKSKSVAILFDLSLIMLIKYINNRKTSIDNNDKIFSEKL